MPNIQWVTKRFPDNSAEVKNSWSDTSIRLYAFMVGSISVMRKNSRSSLAHTQLPNHWAQKGMDLKLTALFR